MSANLITGNLFKPIYAYQDADYQAGISGNVTSIMPVGSKMALSIEDANTIKADDGVLITKEGRRIQIDAGAIEEWSIPTGTQGATNYFIIGFHLYTDSNSAEVCETFVEQMESATDTIPEGTFREGATEVYISLGRVVQSGINLDSVTSLVQIAQSFEDVKNAITQLNSDLITYGQGHNAIFRGKDLGTVNSVASLESFLSSHKVSNGSFSDIYLGDIIHIQDGTYNAEWIVAGFNTHINKGNTNVVKVNHIALIPKTILFNDKMNSTNTTEGGYKASYMHTTVMATVTSKLNAVLGSHLLTRDILISNAVDTSKTSGAYSDWTEASSSWEWVATRCELMSEVEVYGSRILSSSFFDIGEGCMKLPVFNFINHVQYSRAGFWLRGVATSASFCYAYGDGFANGGGASASGGVRPLILIG